MPYIHMLHLPYDYFYDCRFQPPIVPRIRHTGDTRNFFDYPEQNWENWSFRNNDEVAKVLWFMGLARLEWPSRCCMFCLQWRNFKFLTSCRLLRWTSGACSYIIRLWIGPFFFRVWPRLHSFRPCGPWLRYCLFSSNINHRAALDVLVFCSLEVLS